MDQQNENKWMNEWMNNWDQSNYTAVNLNNSHNHEKLHMPNTRIIPPLTESEDCNSGVQWSIF